MGRLETIRIHRLIGILSALFCLLGWVNGSVADQGILIESHEAELQMQQSIVDNYDTIYASFYILREDPSGLRFLAKLRDAAKAGKKVFLIYDGIGAFLSPAMISHLNESGVQVKIYNPPPWVEGGNLLDLASPQKISHRTHDKLFIGFDSTGIKPPAFLSGSRNIGDEYHTEKSGNELSTYLTGKPAKDARAYFERVWRSREAHGAYGSRNRTSLSEKAGLSLDAAKSFAPTTALARNELKEGEAHFSANLIENPWMSSIHTLVQSAERSILVSSPYIILYPELEKVLKRKVKDGLHVNLITNNQVSNDVWIAHSAFITDLPRLLHRGFNLWESLSAKLQHKKVMLIDGKVAYVGSNNFTYRSRFINLESGAIVSNPGMVDQIKKNLEKDLADAKPIKKADLLREPISCAGFLGKLASSMLKSNF